MGTIFLLSGCTMAPEYIRPASPVPANWPTGAAYGEPQASNGVSVAHELHWQEFFTDERLQKLIEEALNSNRDLRLAVLNVERARALYGIQRAELFPTVNAAGSESKQRVPADLSITGKSMTAEKYGVNLGISSWEIDFFGRIRSLKDRALQEYLATEQTRRAAQISLVSEIARVYLTLAADRETLKLARSTLETRQVAYALIHRSYDIGLAAELDLLRAQTQVEAARWGCRPLHTTNDTGPERPEPPGRFSGAGCSHADGSEQCNPSERYFSGTLLQRASEQA